MKTSLWRQGKKEGKKDDRIFEIHILWNCGGDNGMASSQQYRAHDFVGKGIAHGCDTGVLGDVSGCDSTGSDSGGSAYVLEAALAVYHQRERLC